MAYTNEATKKQVQKAIDERAKMSKVLDVLIDSMKNNKPVDKNFVQDVKSGKVQL